MITRRSWGQVDEVLRHSVTCPRDRCDIIYCVEHDVESKEYMAWQEYICEAAGFGFDTPNLRSWCRGCPRTPQKVFDRLRELKANLDKAVEEEKKRMTEKSV